MYSAVVRNYKWPDGYTRFSLSSFSRRVMSLANRVCRCLYRDLPAVCVAPRNAATSISNFILKCNEAAATRLPLRDGSSLICADPYVTTATICGSQPPFLHLPLGGGGGSSLLERLNSRELQLTQRLSRILLRLVEFLNARGEKIFLVLSNFFWSTIKWYYFHVKISIENIDVQILIKLCLNWKRV